MTKYILNVLPLETIVSMFTTLNIMRSFYNIKITKINAFPTLGAHFSQSSARPGRTTCKAGVGTAAPTSARPWVTEPLGP